MLSRLKIVATKVWTITKKVTAIPIASVVVVCRLVSGAGQVLFILPQFIRYVTGNEKHPVSFPAITITMAANVITNFSSRAAYAFNNFIPEMFKKSDRATTTIPQIETDSEKDQISGYIRIPTDDDVEGPLVLVDVNQAVKHEPIDDIEIDSVTGNILLWAMTASSIYAGASSSLGNYLFCIKFIEFIVDNVIPNIKNVETIIPAMPIVQVVAITFFTMSFLNHASFQLKTTRDHVKTLVHYLEHLDDIDRTPINKKAAVITSILGLLGTITVPFLAYFSTNAALSKIPYVSIPEMYKRVLAGISAFSATAQHLTTAIFSAFRFFSKDEDPTDVYRKPACEKAITGIVHASLVSDTACTGISNFVGVTDTCHRAFGLDPKNIYLIGGTIVCSSAAAILNTLLTNEGFKGSKKMLYAGMSAFPEKVAETPDDSTLKDEEDRTFVSVNVSHHHASHFSAKKEVVNVHVEYVPGDDLLINIALNGFKPPI
jgi:hypothetical protein